MVVAFLSSCILKTNVCVKKSNKKNKQTNKQKKQKKKQYTTIDYYYPDDQKPPSATNVKPYKSIPYHLLFTTTQHH